MPQIDVFASLKSLHGVLSVRLSEIRQYQATKDGGAFAARDLIVLARDYDGTVTEYTVPLYANGTDGAAALAVSGPELDALCGPPLTAADPYPARAPLVAPGPCSGCGAGPADLCLCPLASDSPPDAFGVRCPF